jgi:crossover junction endodeoxyribonuclease RusA
MTDLVNLAKERVETRYGGDWLDKFAGPHPAAGGQAPVELDEWILTFAYPKNPLPMNGSRHNHQAHSAKVRGVRLVAKREAQYAGIPHLEHCSVGLTWYVVDGRRRDVVNLSLTLKAMQDGLVDAHVVPDDTPDRMRTAMPAIVRVDALRHREAWMELVVTRWEGPAS